ncbi:MAG: hypothetical protein M3Y91_05390, partial [Actinomycetota bacterium]|nr:hypothetical protein [Actinomycetota bacterium]
RAYTFCVLQQLRNALRRRDVFPPASSRWADPRTRLLSSHASEQARDEVCRSLGHDTSADRELADLTDELDDAYHAVADRLPDNAAVRIETVNARDRPVLTPLDRVDDLPLSVCGVLIAEACNIGLEPLIQPGRARSAAPGSPGSSRTICEQTPSPPPTPGSSTPRTRSVWPAPGAEGT